MRLVEVKSDTASETSRSFTCVIATENPVERWDDSRDMVIREVLTMDGMELRGGRNQMPIVDSHDRSTVANVLGSVRRMRIEGDELIGDATFASDARSQEAYSKTKEGHLTDFSVTATPREAIFVERGQTYTTARGTVVEGPASVVTRWMPTDASICATGADERSIIRRSYFDIPNEAKRAMDQSLLDSLAAMGMPSDLSDPNTVLAWVVGNLNAGKPAETPEDMPSEMTDEEETPAVENMDGEKEDDSEEMKKSVDRALKEERARTKEIFAACTKLNIERSFAEKLIDSNAPLDVARTKIIERAANNELGQTTERATAVKITESEDDKFYAAAHDGLVQRSYAGCGSQRKPNESGQLAPGHEDFSHCSLSRIAERFVERMGVNTNRMTGKDIAMVALGHPATLNRFKIQREAYHSTGSFANLMLDAANKTLLAGYEESPYTWSMWARQAMSVPDFKNINRIRFSEMATPEMVPENHDYPESQMSDSKESYKVEKYGSVFTITWETVVNDDLDAISRIPAMQGAACRRKQNQAVYAVLTSNPTMADDGALFNNTAQTTAGGHANLAGTTGVPSVASLNAGFTSMRTKTGLRNDVILNIAPRYLIVPAALEATALELFTSTGRPDVGGDTTGNSGVQNIYGPGGRRSVTIVSDAVLDGNSATAWYLAADPSQVDTIELSFLQGEESPVLESEWDFDKDVYKNKVRQTFGVAAIDYRGLYKNAG